MIIAPPLLILIFAIGTAQASENCIRTSVRANLTQATAEVTYSNTCGYCVRITPRANMCGADRTELASYAIGANSSARHVFWSVNHGCSNSYRFNYQGQC